MKSLIIALMLSALTGCNLEGNTYEIASSSNAGIVYRVNTKTGEVCQFRNEGGTLSKICGQ